MTHKKQRTLAQTIMNESYSVSAELDVDLRIMCRRLASRLKLILAGTECQPASGCEAHTTIDPEPDRTALRTRCACR